MKTKDYESLSDLDLAVEVNNALSAINNALSAVVEAQQAYSIVLVELAFRQQRRLTEAFARYEPTPDEPVEESARTPPDIEALVTLVYEKFPRTGHSNPKHFALVNGCSGEDGDQDGLRVNALRHAFHEAVRLGFLEKLAEGDEYRWCGSVETGAELEAAAEKCTDAHHAGVAEAVAAIAQALGTHASDLQSCVDLAEAIVKDRNESTHRVGELLLHGHEAAAKERAAREVAEAKLACEMNRAAEIIAQEVARTHSVDQRLQESTNTRRKAEARLAELEVAFEREVDQRKKAEDVVELLKKKLALDGTIACTECGCEFESEKSTCPRCGWERNANPLSVTVPCASCGQSMPAAAREVYKGYCHACTAGAAVLNQKALDNARRLLDSVTPTGVTITWEPDNNRVVVTYDSEPSVRVVTRRS